MVPDIFFGSTFFKSFNSAYGPFNSSPCTAPLSHTVGPFSIPLII